MENNGAEGLEGSEHSRTVANVRAVDERHTQSLERENEFLRTQIGVKDSQIALKDKTIDALLERDRETNILIAGLQKLLMPIRQEGDSRQLG